MSKNVDLYRKGGPLEPIGASFKVVGYLTVAWLVLLFLSGFLVASVGLGAGVIGGVQLHKAITRG